MWRFVYYKIILIVLWRIIWSGDRGGFEGVSLGGIGWFRCDRVGV